jgi:hypothetical protein
MKNFSEKLFFSNKQKNNDNEFSSSGMLKVTTILYVEPLSENSKFTEKVDDSQRFNRFYNSLLNYDYKTGNYVGYWEGKYPHLVNIFIEIARGVKKPN